MLKGYNSDVSVNGNTYHVQTEDWGQGNPFLVSKVFRDGEVLRSIKIPYAEVLPRGPEAVPISHAGFPCQKTDLAEHVDWPTCGSVLPTGRSDVSAHQGRDVRGLDAGRGGLDSTLVRLSQASVAGQGWQPTSTRPSSLNARANS